MASSFLSSKAASLSAFAVVLVATVLYPVFAAGITPVVDGATLPVKSVVLDRFSRLSEGNRFGKLEFMGGLVLSTAGQEMGAMSGIRFLPDQEHFITVMDNGFWAEGRIERDSSGHLSGLADFAISEMIGPSGFRNDRKDFMDAEGLQIVGDQLFVSFEQQHRVSSYPLSVFMKSGPTSSMPITVPAGLRLRHNGGIEALLAAPADSALGQSLFFVAEKSYNAEGDFIAGVLTGAHKGHFFIKRGAPYDVTDGMVLPDGTFLLLERRFGLADGVGTRIRRFNLADVKGQGETVDGETIFEADLSAQIDNMEGIDSFVAPDGSRRIILISDDNHSLLQRNLMLEFKLVE